MLLVPHSSVNAELIFSVSMISLWPWGRIRSRPEGYAARRTSENAADESAQNDVKMDS
jgi:hypothetical protein